MSSYFRRSRGARFDETGEPLERNTDLASIRQKDARPSRESLSERRRTRVIGGVNPGFGPFDDNGVIAPQFHPRAPERTAGPSRYVQL